MRDRRLCSQPCPNDVVLGAKQVCPPLPLPSPLPASNPEPGLIREESWETAEKTTQEIVFSIWPTLVADQKRRDIIQYVKGLVECCTGCKVVPYGSVPLRTYLPDGDIDLTAFTLTNPDDGLVSHVYNVLMVEEHNEAAHYKVKDVHRIDAEVKLLKCVVEDILVDISFNQLGGLGALCFLEQVDHLAGRGHLFKRSIILIKAWCYYESRVLGAHHALISTYALETLVLFIFHQFHTSLKGPLSVLYIFLDYFSKFDWDNYCVSLNGPVCKSSLPDIAAVVPKNLKDDVLLSEEFVQSCRDTFYLSSYGLETNLRPFPLKHLNIIDPLRENNNIGRSVNRGNFYRIRSAFKYGVRKLGWILLLPRERIAAELNKFFANITAGLGNNCRKNVQGVTQTSGVKAPKFLLNLRGDYLEHYRNLQYGQYCNLYSGPPSMSNSFSFPCNGFGEENKRRHGTGTYFPNLICRPYRSRRCPGRGRNPMLSGHVPLETHAHINSSAAASPELISSAECRWTISEPVLSSGTFESSGYNQSILSFDTKSFSCPSKKLEYSSLHPRRTCSAPSPESDKCFFTLHGPASSPKASPTQNCRPFLNSDQKRVKERPYHLRNEDDFPPLSTPVP